MYKNMSRTIKQAKRFAYFTTPYFIPPIRLFRKLVKAARRGVDVRILVPLSSDIGIVDYVSQSFFTLALKSGIRLYRYQPDMIHSKTAVIDDAWATIGSMNLNNQSFKYSYEANIVTTDSACIAELKEQFLTDLDHAQELHLETWEQRSLLSKFLEFFTWPLHGFF